MDPIRRPDRIMFLKRCLRRKGGKAHTYWALVESYRTARGSRHRVVAYLGELSPSEKSGWAQLGRTLEGKRRSCAERSLLDPPHYDDPTEDEPILVQLRDIRLERSRRFGDVWLALGLWRLLGLDVLLEQLIPEGREQIPWHQMAAILTIARFCEPSSELHIEDTWYRPRLSMISSVYRPRRSTPTDCIQLSIDCCPTRTNWSGTCDSGWETSST